MPVRLLLAQAWYFYPRPPRGGRPLLPSMAARARAISIHALREEGDFLTCRVYNMHKNFYPRPPRGGRQQFPLFWLILLLFLSTPSARRATAALWRSAADARDFYPRPPRGGRPYLPPSSLMHCAISIHALREEGDLVANRGFVDADISIHALREEGDPPLTKRLLLFILFLSTPSARRATCSSSTCIRPPKDFYPRPPRGGRHQHCKGLRHERRISIHALREEGDASGLFHCASMVKFLSTPSARRATKDLLHPRGVRWISIHALREEGDAQAIAEDDGEWEFLSTPSARRATRVHAPGEQHIDRFLSTPSARRATYDVRNPLKLRQISIHALREEGDEAKKKLPTAETISIHALREEGD